MIIKTPFVERVSFKEDVLAIKKETLPFNRVVGLGKTDPTPVKLSKLIKQAKEKTKAIER